MNDLDRIVMFRGVDPPDDTYDADYERARDLRAEYARDEQGVEPWTAVGTHGGTDYACPECADVAVSERQDEGELTGVSSVHPFDLAGHECRWCFLPSVEAT